MICLDEGHFAKCCKSGFTCRIRGCGKGHHYLLHRGQNFVKDDRTNDDNGDRIKEQTQGQKVGVTQNDATESPHGESVVNVCAVKASRPRVCFKVVPVRVSVPDRQEVVTYAFLDCGSDATLCLESLVQELSIEDVNPVNYTMTTVNCEQQKTGYDVKLNVRSVSGSERVELKNVLTTDSLPVTPRHIATNEELKEWPHLQDVVLPETRDKRVTILIGSDRPDLIDCYLDRQDGRKGEPCAFKTPLEWTVSL